MFTTIEMMSENSKVWIYQADRRFDDLTAEQIRREAAAFAHNWTAHDSALKASAEVYHNLFLVFAVDESQNDASGCSIDKKVRFVRELESKYGLGFFDRMRIAWREGDQIIDASFSEFAARLTGNRVNDQTIVFNNLVTTMKELQENWEVPLGQSWHKNILVAG
jgi:hypothetical protein